MALTFVCNLCDARIEQLQQKKYRIRVLQILVIYVVKIHENVFWEVDMFYCISKPLWDVFSFSFASALLILIAIAY